MRLKPTADWPRNRLNLAAIASVFLSATLAACGGSGGEPGGGGSQVNQAPNAFAGNDQTVTELTSVNLDARGSTDPDGTIVTYAWVQTGGTPSVTINNANQALANFNAPDVSASTALTFRVTATDNDGASDADLVVVTVLPVAAGSVTISGTLTYDRVPPNTSTSGLDYNNTTQQPIRAATVQLLNGSGNVLATTTSDNTGAYSLSAPPNTSVRVRVLSELQRTGSPNWDLTVVDNTSNGAVYALDGGLATSGTANSTRSLNAPSGWGGASYTGTRAAAPFAIMDSMYEAMSDMAVVDPAVSFPTLTVNWSVNNVPTGGNLASGQIGTSFYQQSTTTGGGTTTVQSNIYVLGAANADTDEFDDHVIIHEWGHYFEGRLSRSDSIGGPHGSGDRLDMRVAFGEGFGNALSGIITDDPFYRDSFGNQQSTGFFLNVETGNDPAEGWFVEASVQEILYDLYDSAADGADNDAVSLGLEPLYLVLTSDEYRNEEAFTAIFPFITQLKASNGAQSAAIDVLVTAQSINSAQINEFGSNENNAPTGGNVLPIYTTAAIGVATGQICSVDNFGVANKLSNRRFVRFDVPSSGQYTITVNGPAGSDPDYFLQRNGVGIALRQSANNGVESGSFNLAAGTHVLELYEFENLDDDGNGTGADICFTVLVSNS